MQLATRGGTTGPARRASSPTSSASQRLRGRRDRGQGPGRRLPGHDGPRAAAGVQRPGPPGRERGGGEPPPRAHRPRRRPVLGAGGWEHGRPPWSAGPSSASSSSTGWSWGEHQSPWCSATPPSPSHPEIRSSSGPGRNGAASSRTTDRSARVRGSSSGTGSAPAQASIAGRIGRRVIRQIGRWWRAGRCSTTARYWTYGQPDTPPRRRRTSGRPMIRPTPAADIAGYICDVTLGRCSGRRGRRTRRSPSSTPSGSRSRARRWRPADDPRLRRERRGRRRRHRSPAGRDLSELAALANGTWPTSSISTTAVT